MQNTAKPWEKDPIIQQADKPLDFSAYGELVEPTPVTHINSLAALNAFKASNPEAKTIGDGIVVRQITQDEWLAKAKQDNQSDRVMDKQSGMSGWMTQDGNHVMIKLGTDIPYDLTAPDNGPAALLRNNTANVEADPEELDYDGEFSDRDFDLFADVVGQIESNGDYTVVGGYNDHYQGKYQFGRLALKDVGIGFSKEARQAFLQDPELQETAFQSLTMQNHKTLMRLSGKYRRLSQREQLAILAMAHNAGAGGALDYLRTGKDTADGFGTAGTSYINAVRSAFQGGEA